MPFATFPDPNGQRAAARLIAEAEADGRKYSPGDCDLARRLALAHEVGILRAHVRDLSAQAAAFESEPGGYEVDYEGRYRFTVRLAGDDLVAAEICGLDYLATLSDEVRGYLLSKAESLRDEAREEFAARQEAEYYAARAA